MSSYPVQPPFYDAPPTRSAALRGAAWAVGGSILRYALGGITALIMMRILKPDDFGLVAITGIVQILIAHIASVGFHDAIIQRPRLDPDDLSAAFWSIMGVSAALILFVVALSFPLARLYGEPHLGPVLIGASFAAMLRAPGSPPRALLTRQMNFRTPVIARLCGMLVAGIGAIAVALAGGGPWSLVLHVALFNGTVTLWIWHVTGWRPRRRSTRPAMRAMWSFAPSVAIFTISAYIVSEADNQFIGYRLGTGALGFYVLAYNTMAWPVRDVLGGVGVVLYPVFSRLQNNLDKLQQAYLDGVQLASLFAFPVLSLLVATAPVFIPALLGPRWIPATLALQILAIGGLREATMMLNGSIYRALGRPELHMLLGLVNVACYLPAFVIGLSWGIEGVALFYVLVGILLHPASLWMVLRVQSLSLDSWGTALRPALLGLAAMLPLIILTLHLSVAWEPIARLMLTWAVGTVTYGLVLWRIRPRVVIRALGELRRFKGK